ncbi:CLUMA_CG015693, isoform A [Clunio marinus]|uniref:CLUMA_CG015693, isoform A n=1 Tax=Clunio marinus TaxID=568069 RepID=A0A1J1IRI2_9DIPT|nr:CLUMA_CG015693, isoform A [Clunio marinus]
MRFLAPENFDTPNNKQGHETGHKRRIEEEKKCLKLFETVWKSLVQRQTIQCKYLEALCRQNFVP